MLDDFIDWADLQGMDISRTGCIGACVLFQATETRVAWAAYREGAKYQRYLDTRIIEGEKVLLTNV
jgi:hypothetical protein